MPTSTFLGLLGACAGFLSATFFALGTLRLKPKDVAAVASTYWDFNQHLANSIASQRAEYIVGALLLVLSFSLQFAANIVPPTLQPSLLQPFGFALVATGLFFAGFGLLSWHYCRRVAKRTKVKVHSLLQAQLEPQAELNKS